MCKLNSIKQLVSDGNNDENKLKFIFQHGPSFNSNIASHNCRIKDSGRLKPFNPIDYNIYEKFTVFTQSSSFVRLEKTVKEKNSMLVDFLA